MKYTPSPNNLCGWVPVLSHFFLAALVVAGTVSVAAQNATPSADWVMVNPEGEEFSVSMPKDSTSAIAEQNYHKMILKTRLYLSASKTGPVLAVASLSGIKSNPALYSDFQRMNSYVDAFKEWFPEKIGRKAAVPKLTLIGPKTLNGNEGREYRLVIGDLSGSLEVYATRKRFYAITVLNTKKDDELQDRFLSSFVLPEKSSEPASVTRQSQPAAESGTVPTPAATVNKLPDGGEQKLDPNAAPEAANNEQKPAEASDQQAAAQSVQKRGPITGGVLNGKALYLPKPEYPPEAYNAKASGTVVIQVIIDEQGSVMSAHAVSGHPLLQAACVAAARQARFSPTTLMGEPVKVTGVLTYNFAQ